MSETNNLLIKLSQVKRLGQVSKLRRMVQRPMSYLLAVGYRNFAYPIFKKSIKVKTPVFFGEKLIVALPAGTDIYLTGGKSHDSEVRLAGYLIKNLIPGSVFIDVGAHYGYFTRLAAHLVGNNGAVYAFEPSSDTYKVLNSNCAGSSNIVSIKKIVGDTIGEKAFLSFASLHSEYASTDIHQYENEAWFENAKPSIMQVESTTIDDFAKMEKIIPSFIKVDAEGGELNVLRGAKNILSGNGVVIAMEYLQIDPASVYVECVEFMNSLGYKANVILTDYALQEVENVEQWMIDHNADSENVIFTKVEEN